MIEHSFNTEVAKLVGVNAAIIFKNISHWCEKNKANKSNFHDGEYWTYNSIKAFEEMFPYLSNKQIRSALDKLHKMGFIGYGEYNKNPYDRTRWYCDLTQKVGLIIFLSSLPKGEMDKTDMANVDLPKRDKSITDINTYVNTDSKHLNIINETSSLSEKDDVLLNDVPLPKKKEMTLYQKFVDIWLKEFKVGWGFKPVDGKKMKSMISNIKRSLKNHRGEYTEQECTDLFRHFLINLPDFYKTKSLSILESNYDSIIEEIKNEKSKRKPNHSRASGSISFFKNL